MRLAHRPFSRARLFRVREGAVAVLDAQSGRCSTADESRKSPMLGVPVTVHSAKCTKSPASTVELSFQDDNARRRPRALCALARTFVCREPAPCTESQLTFSS